MSNNKQTILGFLKSFKRMIIPKQNLNETKKKSIKRNSDLKPVVSPNMEVKKDEPLEESSQHNHLEDINNLPFQEKNPVEPNCEVKVTYNVRALTKHAETYELETFEKKTLLIFNQIEINDFDPRYGTEKDVEALENTFSRFGFEVTEYKDLTKNEILCQLQIFFKQDFTDHGCIGIVVLSHGSDYGELWAKDMKYSEMEIIKYFNVYDKPTLVTKPKFLIIQACRGTKIIPGVPVFTDQKYLRKKALASRIELYHLPVDADVLILHSSYIGSPSYRDERDGSWYIQSLCERINQLAATHDLETIITSVKHDVAVNKGLQKYNPSTMQMQVDKQMPVMTSTLIRKLYLKRFEEVSMLPVPDCDVTHL